MVVVPAASDVKREIVVFDIDGTLTPTNWQILEARPDAARAVEKYARAGYRIVYLTARVRPFRGAVPALLNNGGFPAGDVVLPQTADDQDEPGTFKTRILNEYLARGWSIAAAYGDSETDFIAYSNAKAQQVYALRRQGDEKCQSGAWKECLPGWTEHLKEIPAR